MPGTHTDPSTVEDWARSLSLLPHPEGGFYREVYRADEIIPAASLPSRYNGQRVHSTHIYYLLPGNTFSAFHRIRSDEAWHFYTGCPVELHVLGPDRNQYQCLTVGMDIAQGHFPFVMIPRNTWFAAKTLDPKGFALVGCTVAPGFDFEDFEIARSTDLMVEFPQHTELIASLCRN